ERLEKDFVLAAVDDLDGLVAERKKLADDVDGQRLVGLRHDKLTIEDILERHLVAEFAFVHLVAEGMGLRRIEVTDDVAVARVAEDTQESRRQELPAAAAAVEVNVKQVVGVKPHLQPGTAIGNDAERVEELAN